MQKFSRQRQAIKDYMMTRQDHPTAEMVYTAVRKEYPNISLGTIYRNLSLLAANGELSRFVGEDGVDHFDPNTDTHYHIICEECGAIHDLPLDVLKGINDLATHFYDGEVTRHSIFFYGKCSKCKAKTDSPEES